MICCQRGVSQRRLRGRWLVAFGGGGPSSIVHEYVLATVTSCAAVKNILVFRLPEGLFPTERRLTFVDLPKKRGLGCLRRRE
jgi:hypothetical protein